MNWRDIPAPVIIGHRGASAHAPENTLAAFTLAAKQGAHGVEFDVKLTADGHVIVIHDQTVDRTTNGHGKVKDLPLAAFKELDAGTNFSARCAGEPVPTLEEVFSTIGSRLYMNVELTNYATPLDALVEKVADLVRRFGLEQRVLFSSFFPANLLKAARLLPNVPRGLLVWPSWMGWWGRSIGYKSGTFQALHPYLHDTDASLVEKVQDRGRQVNVWTVNKPEDIRRMIKLGVDGIISDDPALALSLLGGSP